MQSVALTLLLLASHASSLSAGTAEQIHWTLIGPTAVTFDWVGTEDVISYGTSPGLYSEQMTSVPPEPLPDGAGPFHEAHLTGLLANQRYYYQIGSGPQATFRTPPPPGSSDFWFGEEADIGSSHTYLQVAMTQDSMAVDEVRVPGDDRPAFVLVPGDISYGDQGDMDDVNQHFNDVMAWSRSAAYMPTWGNHDWDPAGSPALDQVNDYKGRFDLPNPRRSPGTGTDCVQGDVVTGEDWYWFDYGNVRFIAVPPASEGPCGYYGARQAWRLAADSVMSSVDSNPQIGFIVTFGHFPGYSSGADHEGNPVLALDFAALRAVHPKYVLNITAHSHHYERFDPALTGGLLTLVAAGGGSKLGGLAAPLPETVERYNHTEHLKIHVAANRIDGYCVCGPSRPEESDVCARGRVIDMFSILPGGLVDVPPGGRPALPVRAGWYDVQGRRVEPGAAGAYFRPGKPRTIIR